MASEGQEASQAPALTSLPRVEDLPSARRIRPRKGARGVRGLPPAHDAAPGPAPGAAGRRAERPGRGDRARGSHGRAAHDPRRRRIRRHDRAGCSDRIGRANSPHRGRSRAPPARAPGASGRRRPLPPGKRAPARGDHERGQGRGPPDPQDAQQQAAQEIAEAESRAARLLEQARHQATELTNSVRAEVEQTLEWARAQAAVIIGRAQEGAEQLLSAAGSRRRGDRPGGADDRLLG